MEDNLMEGMKEWMDNAQSDVNNFKKLTDDNYEKLDDKQKNELNEALDGMDMKALNKVVTEASATIMTQIQDMFK